MTSSSTWARMPLVSSSTLVSDRAGWSDRSASKTLAERAFWDYFKNNITRFDGVATLPGAIFGAPTQFGTDLPGTTQMILPWLQGPMPESQLNSIYYNLVHVSDSKLSQPTKLISAARANVRALTVPEAGGERFLIISDQLFANDVALVSTSTCIYCNPLLTNRLLNSSPSSTFSTLPRGIPILHSVKRLLLVLWTLTAPSPSKSLVSSTRIASRFSLNRSEQLSLSFSVSRLSGSCTVAS